MATRRRRARDGLRAAVQAPGAGVADRQIDHDFAREPLQRLAQILELEPLGDAEARVARNILTPVKGSPSRPLANSSMLTPRPVSAWVTSRTMPGRSLPRISSLRSARAFPRRGAALDRYVQRRFERACERIRASGFPPERWRAGRRRTCRRAAPSGFRAMSRAGRDPCEISLMRPGRSSPTKVRTSGTIEKLLLEPVRRALLPPLLRVSGQAKGRAPQITIQAGEMGNSTNWLSFPATAIVGVRDGASERAGKREDSIDARWMTV